MSGDFASHVTSQPAISSASSGGDDLCVHALVAARALAQPDALAVAAADASLTYGDLNHRADRLACQLRALGVGPDVLVGLCLDRSSALVVGALAILKAGGAYVALDPAYPDERVAFMLRDARVHVLVTHESLAARFAGLPLTKVTLTSNGSNLGPWPTAWPSARASHRDLAYLIYTSGSTGTPKGVMIEHRGLLALVRWHQRAFAVTPDDRATQLASPGFDAAVWELWPNLVAGASVHVPDQATRDDVEALRDWLVAQRITITFLPTPLAEAALNIDWPPETRLRFLLTGGDALHRYPRLGLPFTLVNNYGPTEGTVVATSGVVHPTGDAGRAPSIGRPIDHVDAYVLDADLSPVPTGAAGELVIGGAGIARGYLNRPELTEERFVRDSFGDDPGAWLYRTGDVVRWQNGELEFLGRLDEQVKIRGLRVEPSEISALLDNHPDVGLSFVMARERGRGDKILVGYVVPSRDHRPQPGDLRAHLARLVPEAMIPAAFVFMDQLPLTANGKVDRNALPAPPAERQEDLAAPSSELERQLAAMVAELLGLEHVGVGENFFRLGGHSLLGAQLLALIRSRFAVQMTLRSLFDAATVAGMAAEVERLLVAELDAMTEEEAERLAASSLVDSVSST